jgi:hypothetical protein
MVKIVLQKFGKIPNEKVEDIVTVIEECYKCLKPHNVELVDLCLFERSSAAKAFLLEESSKAGAVSTLFDELFFATHEAWRGTSRITLCFERMEKLPRLVQLGGIRHEVGHSVLHGSIEYYTFPIAPALRDISEKFRFSKRFSSDLSYLIFIAVKDFEVAKLLMDKGYIEDQLAYSEYVLSTSEEDLAAWRMAKGDPASTALCLAGRLKDLACYVVACSKLKKSPIDERIRNEFSYLPDPIAEKMLKIAEELPRAVVGDTFQNTNTVIEIFLKNLFESFKGSELYIR